MAKQANPYLAGNKVYKGGTSAPTRGTVDPMGYINRSMNQPSQQRSGLAQAALQRQQGQMTGLPGIIANRPQPTPIPRPAGVTGIRPMPNMITGPRPTPITQPVSNNQGQIFANPMQSVVPISTPNNALPAFDPEYAQGQQDALTQKNRTNNGLLEQEQNLELDYVSALRDVNQSKPRMLSDILNNFGSRGLANSSGYGLEVGGAESKVANMIAQLGDVRTRGRNSIDRGRLGADEDFASQLARLQTEATRRLSEQAGDLGLGQPGASPIPGGMPLPQPGKPLDPNRPPGADNPTAAPMTPDQRVAKIVDDVMNGRRTMNSVRESLDRLAGTGPTMDYGTINDAPYMNDPVALRKRILDSFTNRGVGLDQFLPVGQQQQLPVGAPVTYQKPRPVSKPSTTRARKPR